MDESSGKDGSVRPIESTEGGRLASWEVFQQYIHPGQTVVAMGPGASIAYDSSFLITAHLLGQSGNLLVVDPKSITRSVRLDEAEKGPIRGAGDVDLHLRQLEYLHNEGMNIARPIWVGPYATCASTTLLDKSCEVIVDHNTSPFVTGSDDKRERVYWLTKTYQEYARILQPGGILLLQTSNKRYKFGEERGKIRLTQLLEDSGFQVTTQEVEDTFVMPLSPTEAKLLRNVPIEAELFDTISHNIKKGDGQFYFERNARQSQFVVPHESINMYIGIRQ